MSKKQPEESTTVASDTASKADAAAAAAAADEQSSAKLSGLMASEDAPAKGAVKPAAKPAAGSATKPGAKRPDLDAEAVAAAQSAIAEGERALAEARAQLTVEEKPRPRASSRRELALRLLLAANVLAMIVVVSLPQVPGQPEAVVPAVPEPAAIKPKPPAPVGPRLADKYNQALLASDAGEFARAITLLTEYLADSPRMPASRLVNVYRAMAHYAGAIGRFTEAQDYERRAQAVSNSHSLPQDLVAMAHAAMASGDQESLRQVWARFLLQQRQIPSSLYQHVAEAYLQLGDSYRLQANAAAEQARITELEKTDALLREQGRARDSKR